MERRLAAILAADVVGYSRLVGGDEEGTIAEFKSLRVNVIEPLIAEHRGRLVKLMGDGFLVEFQSAVDAVKCAIAWQTRPAKEQLIFRIGVNLGDIVMDGDDIFGDGVNVAARLEGLAEPGGIVISDVVQQSVRARLDTTFDDRGMQTLKNIEQPVRIWKWVDDNTERNPNTDVLAATEKPSIAVLPFTNMSGDPEQEYFADGIADDIITDLSQVSGLMVIARNSSFSYKGKSPDVRQVCSDLNVRYVVEGSVRRAGEMVRINAQLIDGRSGGHLWANRYNRKLEDIFILQDEVTREIVSALQVALTSDERNRRNNQGKTDPIAYDYVIRARTCYHQLSAEGMREAREMLERAIAIDEDFAPAYALLSETYFMSYVNGWNNPSSDNLTTALEFAEKAVALDGNEPRAYRALAISHIWLRNLEQAQRAAERAIELDPSYAAGYSALANVHHFCGRHERAVELLQMVLRLDPQYIVALQFLGRALFQLGRYDEAERNFKRQLVRTPRSDMTRAYLASLYGHTGRLEAADTMWLELQEINPDFSLEHLHQTLPYRDARCFEHLVGGLDKAGLLG